MSRKSFQTIKGRINIKTSSCCYRKSQSQNKTFLRPSYSYNGISNTGRRHRFIESEPIFLVVISWNINKDGASDIGNHTTLISFFHYHYFHVVRKNTFTRWMTLFHVFFTNDMLKYIWYHLLIFEYVFVVYKRLGVISLWSFVDFLYCRLLISLKISIAI